MNAHTFTPYKGGDVEFTKNDNWEHWITCGHAVRRCDATTGHAVRDVAYCDTKERAVALVSALAHRADLLVSLREIADFCDDPNGSENPESLASGLARMLPAARAALAKAESQP